MKGITVFCGASIGKKKVFEEVAFQLGQALALQHINLIYGGANIGLMGAVANGALSENGNVIGVIPHFLAKKEISHQELTELKLVDTMHERKTIMSDLADGFIALPGGIGTMEELFEILTWAQLGLHKKPIGILNVNGFYTALISLVQQMVENGFLKEIDQNRLVIRDSIPELLNAMHNYDAPKVGKLISMQET